MSPRNCACPSEDDRWLDLCAADRLHAQAAADHIADNGYHAHTDDYRALAESVENYGVVR
jgi:hypothetical protein